MKLPALPQVPFPESAFHAIRIRSHSNATITNALSNYFFSSTAISSQSLVSTTNCRESFRFGRRSIFCSHQRSTPRGTSLFRQKSGLIPISFTFNLNMNIQAMSTTARGTKPMIHLTIESIRSFRKTLGTSVSVGFVPTMGALHEGHLSLARAARAQNDIVVASIFVNPTQFGQGEDLEKYPRQLEKDVEMLGDIGVDHIFAPSSDIMYGKNHVTYVDPMGFDQTKEGMSRDGHFRGVATVVTKLFNIVQPNNAYFGQKDAVQCVLIRRIVEDLDMDVNVQIMDTIREEDGLAMSSRNAYLTEIEREKSTIVYKALCAAREMFDSRFARGEEMVSANDLKEVVENILLTEPLVREIQYVSVDDLERMLPLENVGSEGCVISLACILGSVRLIDNIVLR